MIERMRAAGMLPDDTPRDAGVDPRPVPALHVVVHDGRGARARSRAWRRGSSSTSATRRTAPFHEIRRETLPAEHVFGRRLEMMTLAVMSQLRPRGNWYRIAREWLYDDEPQTELGATRPPTTRAAMSPGHQAERARPARRARSAAAGPGPRCAWRCSRSRSASLFIVLALSGSLSPETVSERVDEFGWAGPLVFIVVSMVLTCAMFPGPMLAGAAGLLFGTALGTPVAIVSATLGACLACIIGRFVAGDAVEELGGPRIRALAAWVGARGFTSVLYARIAPAMPYNVVNYACGLTTIPIPVVAAATAIGTAPRTFAYVALGGSFGDFSSPGGDHRDRDHRRDGRDRARADPARSAARAGVAGSAAPPQRRRA